jgi:uncharacterized glyoxalase superfamily protein PhnB
MPKRMVENTIPILRVANLAASAEYYAKVLGFTEQWRTGDTAGMARDGHGIYLTDADQGQLGSWVWVGVEDLDALYQEVTASGATIIMELTDFPWAREFRIQDPDGNVLRLGGEPAPEPQ